MRILIVSHFFLAHGGGIERVAAHMARHLSVQGHHVEWAASMSDDLPLTPDFTSVPLGCVNPTEALTGLPMPIPGPQALARIWKAIGQAEIVVIHDALYCTSIAAMAIARMRRKPVILIQHVAQIAFASALMRGVMALANRMVTRPMLRMADQTIFISETVRSFFASLPMRQPALLQFNGVNTCLFRPGLGDYDHFAMVDEKVPLIAFVGRFVEKKGLEIIRALARLRPSVHFVLVGAGPIDPRQWNLPNVHVCDPLPPADIAALFRQADYLLLPSVGEGYPLVIQEAMATGLPVICGEESARADPGASQWLRGIEIDLRDVDGSALRAAEALDQPPLDAQDRAAMACHARDHYSWEAFATRISEVAKLLIAPRDRRPSEYGSTGSQTP
ncbi:hypothetical protein TomMM35A_33670 [Sphingobium sp. TomMM35A]